MPNDSLPAGHSRASGLVDVLDRILDKGLVIAGDIKVSVAEVELLTIRIRLMVCSIDKAEQIGLDWWKHDPELTSRGRKMMSDNDRLHRQIRALEQRVAELSARNGQQAGASQRRRAPRPKGRGRAGK